MSSSADNTITTCANCGKDESDAVNLKRCTACKMVKYCSRDCQVAHRPKHKKECKRRAAELFDEELFKDPPEGPECPICMLPLPFGHSQMYFRSCCGKSLCCGCVYAHLKEDIRNGKEREDQAKCEFCRTPDATTDEEEVERINAGIERNNANSMEQLAVHYINGTAGLRKDLTKAIELLEKAGRHGIASAYGRLAYFYYGKSDNDMKKAKYYLELAAIGGCIISRNNLAVLEEGNSNNLRAGKHYLICAKAGYEPSLNKLKKYFKNGHITKDEYTEALRAYNKHRDDRKSAMRDEVLEFDS